MLRQGIARGAWLVTLGPGLLFAAIAGTPAAGERTDSRPTPRVECTRPGTLRLHRFEDGSAQLLCARQVIVRVSVPR
jgi:hypothetical protein